MIGLFLNLLDTQNEKDKFIKLYDKYKNMLYWISYGKTQSCQDAEECVQETFFYVAKHFEKIGDVNSSQTKGYLATIVTGFSIDVYNKSKKYGRIDIENNNIAENLSYFDNIETVELSSAIESVLSEEEKFISISNMFTATRAPKLRKFIMLLIYRCAKSLKEPKRN